MGKGELGKIYGDGELIVRQGDQGDCLFVIQEGEVEVFRVGEGEETPLAVLGKDEFFGEVPLFERQLRSASVRAKGTVRVLTVDRKTLLRRIQEDPTLAYRILETMSRRIRQMDDEISRLMTLFGKPSQPS